MFSDKACEAEEVGSVSLPTLTPTFCLLCGYQKEKETGPCPVCGRDRLVLMKPEGVIMLSEVKAGRYLQGDRDPYEVN